MFFLHNGYWPIKVDHNDRDRINNAPDNLLDATHSENNQNKNVRKDSASGIKGVSYDAGRSKPWRADFKRKPIRKVKRFNTKDEAITQRKQWEQPYDI